MQRVLTLTTAIWHDDRSGQPVLRSRTAYTVLPSGIRMNTRVGGIWRARTSSTAGSQEPISTLPWFPRAQRHRIL